MSPINGYGGNWTQKIRRPAEKLAFTDGIDWWVEWSAADYSGAVEGHDEWGWDKLGQANIRTYKDRGFHGPTIYRHSEGANVAFYDGHVKYMHKEDIFVIEDYEAEPKRPGMWVADLRFYRVYHP
jgi:prepilin-type processing-associated H-X9-DG protein